MAPVIRMPALILTAISVALTAPLSAAADWPTFGHDARRSQISDEPLDFAKLSRSWVWTSPQPPLAAWGQPAKGDAFADLRDFQSMRNYDPVFHPIVAGDALYFGSNVDDSVRSLDAATGKVRWTHIAGGPVRIAPTFHDGRVYFGADDGFAYCLDAKTGGLIWRMSPSADESPRRVLNDGRLISFWPCRSGVLVAGETAYFTCSLLPWKSSYLCAVDAKTGQSDGDGRYVQKLDAVTLEGPLVADADLLYSPQGRESPLQFQRGDGKSLGTLGEGFGVFCVLTPQNRLLHGPRKKEGGIVDSDAQTRAPVATHKDARAMIVSADTSFLLTNSQLAAGDLASRKMRWKLPQSDVVAMILVGDALVLGQRDRVAALDTATGEEVWSAPVDGRAMGLAAAGGALYVSTETGRLIRFGSSGASPSPLVDEANTAPTIKDDVPVIKSQPIEPMDDEHLLDRWVFSSLAVKADGERHAFNNQAAGLPATLTGKLKLTQDAGLDAVALDGAGHSITVTDDSSKAKLPKKELTAEAWVRIDQPLEWGGIVGAIQDNGNYERGWLLGYRDAKFCFALAGMEASGRLTYMSAQSDFRLGRWHHVAATYDGAAMRLYVDGQPSAASTAERGDINYPPRAFYEIGAYRDENEHYRTNGLIHEVRVYNRVLSADEVLANFKSKPLASNDEATLAAGPWVQFDTDSSAVVRWESAMPTASRLVLTDDGGRKRPVEDDERKTRHELKLDHLLRDRRYTFVIEADSVDQKKLTRPFELDTYFNYNLAPLPASALPDDAAAKSRYAQAAGQILKHYDRPHGLCLVVGSETGELAIELARRHNLRVIGLETDAEKMAAARRRAVDLGIYGPRCSFIRVESVNELPVPSNIANLVVSQTALTGELTTPARELDRVLQPDHWVDIVTEDDAEARRKFAAKLESFGFKAPVKSQFETLQSVAALKGPLAGTADWTHMYGDAGNAAYAGETLGGVKATDELEVAWLGRPGPRYQTDRQNRKSSPLFAGGRLFMQGQERIIALDGYNGLILWSLEIPGLLRFNIPRDASNWCCDKEHLFIAVRDRCWQIDGETGRVAAMHGLPAGDNPTAGYEWGYLARTGDLILGSSAPAGSAYTEFWGTPYWFDQKEGPYTYQVCSDDLFAIEKSSGKSAWRYARGKIWNASLTVGGGRVYFIESRGEKLTAKENRQTGRVPTADLAQMQFLVALDLATGKPVWEQPLEISDHVLLANIAYSDGRLVLVESVDKQFPVQSFSADTGKRQWGTTVPWPRADHGGHLSRPAIVGNRLFVRPAVLDMTTGEVLSNNIPGGGCGTYVCTHDALFFRAGSGRQLSTWHPETGQYTHWPRLRPDCWLSTIPAGGMLLSPEGGGGCSCGHWMEMSLGFQPVGQVSRPARP